MNNKKLKLLHILNSLLPSGAETMLKNSAHLLTDYDKYILVTAKDIGSYANELENAGYTIIHIYNSNMIKQHISIISYLRENKFDVVHVHRESQSLFYELDAKFSGVKNIVRTIHSCFEFNGVLRIRRIVTRKLAKVLKVKQIAIGDSVYENEKGRFYNVCNKIIYNWYDDKKISFINTTEHISRKMKLQMDLNTFYLLSVGNCSTIKNHKLIIEALKILISKGYNIHYIHIGCGSEEEKEKLLVQDLQLEAYVKFLGSLDPADYFAACDLFIMPSLFEGFGIAAVEAMATGIPTILSDVSGLRDFRKHNLENISYCPLVVEDFVEVIENYYFKFQNNNLLSSRTQADTIRDNYGMEKSVREYSDEYRM